MPIPKPRDSEDRDAFVSRCMGADFMVEEFPDNDQRLAVCFRQLSDRGKGMEYKFCAFELKETADSGHVTGYGSVFGNVDQGGDIVAKGAFADSLKSRQPKMLWGHDHYAPAIGVWNEASEDDHGLLLEGQINLRSQMGKDVHSALAMKAIDGMSIGYLVNESETDKAGITTLNELELWEVSFVNFPMNVAARVDAVKAKILNGTMTKREVERILRDAGFTCTQAKAFLSHGFSGLKHRDDGDDITDELRKTIRKVNHG